MLTFDSLKIIGAIASVLQLSSTCFSSDSAHIHTYVHTLQKRGVCVFVYSSNGKLPIEESMMMSRLAGSQFSHLRSELPLGVFGCTQVLRQLLVLNSILYIF